MSLFRNSSIVLAGTLIANVLAYAFHFIAGRMLGPMEYGELGAVMALYMLLSIPLGSLIGTISKYTFKFNKDNKNPNKYSFQKTIRRDLLATSIFLFALISMISGPLIEYLHLKSRAALISIGVLFYFNALLAVANGVLLALKRYAMYSISTFAESLIRLFFLILLLQFGLGYFGGVLAFGIAYLITYIFMNRIVRERSSGTSYFDFNSMKPAYKYFLQLLVVNMLIQCLLNVPSLLIKHYYSSELAGYWTAALNVARISLFVSSAIGQVLFTELLNTSDRLAARTLFRNAIRLTILGGSFFFIILYWKADVIISFLYGSTYLSASPYLKQLGFAMIAIGVIQVWSNYRMARLN